MNPTFSRNFRFLNKVTTLLFQFYPTFDKSFKL